jgi:hypothetical protein
MRAILPIALLVACTSGSTGAGERATAPLEPATRDSAGVTIHEHGADALERAPLITLVAEPIFEQAGTEESADGDVSSVNGFLFTRSGDLVGFDRQEQQVVVIRADGGPLRRIGQGGEGPGSFGRFGNFLLLGGDTLLFRDGANSRLSIIDPRSGVLGERSWASVGRPGTPIGRTGTGEFVFQNFGAMVGPDATSGPHREPLRVQSWRAGADSVRDRFTAGEILMWREVRSSSRGIAVAMRSAALTVEPQIGMVRDRLRIAAGLRWHVDERDLDGNLVSTLRIARPATPLTDPLWNRYADSMVRQRLSFDSTLDAAQLRNDFDAERQFDSLPVLQEMVITPNETLWVIDYLFLGDSTWSATAFDPDGRILGRIVDEAGDPPVAIGNDRMAFRTEDDLGIATITVRRVVMP